MATIRVETFIKASAETCFDLARDIDVHLQTTGTTGEKAIAGVTSGKMQLHDFVTFEARHFGIRQRLTSQIVEYERPHYFIDQMTKGPFKRLRHEHRFEPINGGTMMIDVMDFASPFGPIGTLVDKLLLAKYMASFLARRGHALKEVAEIEANSFSGHDNV